MVAKAPTCGSDVMNSGSGSFSHSLWTGSYFSIFRRGFDSSAKLAPEGQRREGIFTLCLSAEEV